MTAQFKGAFLCLVGLGCVLTCYLIFFHRPVSLEPVQLPPFFNDTKEGPFWKPDNQFLIHTKSSSRAFSSPVNVTESSAVNLSLKSSAATRGGTPSVLSSPTTSAKLSGQNEGSKQKANLTLSVTSPQPAHVNAGNESHQLLQNSTKLLCVGFTGRLGNELFEYASTLALSLTMNRTPVFMGSVLLPKVLKNFDPMKSSNQSEIQARCKNASSAFESSCCKYSKRLTELNPAKDYRIGLYLQSYRYFENHEDYIKNAVTFSDAIRSEAETYVKELRKKHNASTMVGVHIRRGDLLHDQFKNLGYPLASPAYLRGAVSFFQNKSKDVVFVVGSDSVDWCKQNFPNASRVYYLEGHQAAVDMWILASLDHAIITFGTFSWWIGYLNHGTTVYMKNLVIPDSYVGKQYNPDGKDHVYPGWIPL